MKISGFSMGKNALKLYYPMRQSVESILPLVDEFIVALGDSDDPGAWQTVDPRHPSQRSQAQVLVTVIGANDPPTPVRDDLDEISSSPQEDITEESIIRVMADPDLAGSSTAFDTDDGYPQVVVLQENPPEELRDKVMAAARYCPNHVITVVEE